MAQQILNTNTFGVAKWIVSSDATQGTHTTIATALTSASSGDTIFLRDGTYTENITLKAGVDICGLPSNGSLNATGNVVIVGTCTLTTAGSVTISNIQMQTNSAVILAVTGTLASNITLNNCYLNLTNNTGITYSSSSATSGIIINNCYIYITTTAITLYTHTSNGQITITNCLLVNSGNSTLASSNSSGVVLILYSYVQIPFGTTSSGTIAFEFCLLQTNATNTIGLLLAGTGSSQFKSSQVASGSASGLSIGAGTTLVVTNSTVDSTNTNAVTGAGIVLYDLITFPNTSSLINTSTQTKRAIDTGSISFDGGTTKLSALPVGVASGGTGAATLTGVLIGNGTSAVTASTVTQYGTVIAGASNAVSSVAPSPTSGIPYISQGAGSNPVFGTTVVPGGGTGNITQTAYSLVAGGTTTTGAFQAVGPNASSNAILYGQGSSALPAFLTNGTPYVTGISFDAGTTTLSIYATGTWTVTLIGGTLAGATTYVKQQGYYTRIGNLIWITGYVSGTIATGTGNATIGGLPFTVKNQTDAAYTGSILSASAAGWVFPVGTTMLTFSPVANTTTAIIYASGTATAGGNLQMANAAFLFQFTAVYQI